MPSVFNIIRFCVYGAVLVWTIICLAIAAHFESILVSSDLTHFVPFAIFVCCVSVLIILALLGFGLWRERNPISTRIELGCLGLAGVLWLALSAFIASSDAEDADVECYSSADSSDVVSLSSFNTEIYQAQYRVLEAFSFFNLILILGFSIFLLVLALRHHRRGERYVWIVPVTAFTWFGQGGKKAGKLPAPVTQRSRSRSRPALDEKQRKDSQRSKASKTERPESWRIVDYIRPLAYRNDTTRTQDTGRTTVNRQDSSRSQVARHDSQRERGRPSRSDSQRTQVNRQDSQRTHVNRQDSQRTHVNRQDSQRDRNHPYRQDSTRSQPRRQDSQSRRLPQTAVNEPTRNEAPTYVYWLPHKAPEQAHMTQLFKEMRLYGFITILLLSATVLGISAYLGSIFLPNIQHDFGIYSIVTPSLTILVFLITLSWSAPRTEAVVLFVLGVMWLAMGAWSADMVGNTQCDAINSSARSATKSGTVSTRSWCYEMKVIEAFSWMIFCLFAIFLWVLISLTSRARAFGYQYAWAAPIFELPWFGELPGWPYGGQMNGGQMMNGGQYPMGMYPTAGVPYQPGAMNGGYVIQQAPGHSVVIQPGPGGGAPTITQVPGSVSSVP
ncbi:uncharacterized protein C8Q71DRAFT_852362 [Rhodofomes roseus]|uniref:MARVEL domain-containing protein n=1 Tax=Rhodofomes roseus TaxID=34475 RepID=A0ABQ8KXR4_9APHY|nr:uncharacterized protein C8Q71DRAFT_852362 [Rhodofomes roseus]KAH9843838.1 hypothetical protein C8Q71DRAFT_852362 [Rhodofomes roseus]